MNFFFTHDNKILLDKHIKEYVLIISPSILSPKYIIFHFPRNRFANFKQKKELFIKNINGEIQSSCITTSVQNYNIYEQFYLCFY
jgi:hypothetical protein